MATRNALRIVSRRFSSGKEEKAAKNVFIKGPGEHAAAGSAIGANGSGATSKASAESGLKVSEDKNRKLRGIRRFSSGKVLSEEERAAENVFFKNMEQEKLEKIARQLERIEDKARDDKARDDVVALAILAAIGWWFFKG